MGPSKKLVAFILFGGILAGIGSYAFSGSDSSFFSGNLLGINSQLAQDAGDSVTSSLSTLTVNTTDTNQLTITNSDILDGLNLFTNPTDSQTDISITPVFEWNEANNADSYTLEVQPTSGGTTITKNLPLTSINFALTGDELEHSTEYSADLIAYNGSTEVATSSITFTTVSGINSEYSELCNYLDAPYSTTYTQGDRTITRPTLPISVAGKNNYEIILALINVLAIDYNLDGSITTEYEESALVVLHQLANFGILLHPTLGSSGEDFLTQDFVVTHEQISLFLSIVEGDCEYDSGYITPITWTEPDPEPQDPVLTLATPQYRSHNNSLYLATSTEHINDTEINNVGFYNVETGTLLSNPDNPVRAIPYAIEWDLNIVQNATYTIEARMLTNGGITVTSDPVTYTVTTGITTNPAQVDLQISAFNSETYLGLPKVTQEFCTSRRTTLAGSDEIPQHTQCKALTVRMSPRNFDTSETLVTLSYESDTGGKTRIAQYRLGAASEGHIERITWDGFTCGFYNPGTPGTYSKYQNTTCLTDRKYFVDVIMITEDSEQATSTKEFYVREN